MLVSKFRPRSAIILGLLLTTLGALGVYLPTRAQRTTSQYTTGFQVQNLEASKATLTITFYNRDGSQAAQTNDTLSGRGSKTYFPLNQVNEGFDGSVTVASDRQVAAIGNVLRDGGQAAASYSAPTTSSGTILLPLSMRNSSDSSSSLFNIQNAGQNVSESHTAANRSLTAPTTSSKTILLPLLMKGNSGFSTWFNVQNAGQTAAAVQVAYSDGTVADAIIEPGSAHTFDQSEEIHSTKVFSAIITSDQPLAAVVIQENSAVMFAYNGFAQGAIYPRMPLISFNSAGYVTGVQIQNAGDTETTVTVLYTDVSSASTCSETQTISAGQSATFALNTFAGSPLPGVTTDCTPGSRLVGSARVTTNTTSQPLTVIVNQLNPYAETGGSYNGFSGGSGTVVLPLIMDRNSGYFTGFNIQNVGAGTTTVDCTFTNSTYTVSRTLDPGEALNDLQMKKLADRYVGSATCTASDGGEIVGVVNELGPSTNADQLLVYEGINLP